MYENFDAYRTPGAVLEDHAAGDLGTLPNTSTWLVFFLSLITMGVYTVWWLHSRSRNINEALPNRPIANGFVVVLPVLYIAMFVFGVLDEALGLGVYANYPFIGVFDFAFGIGLIVWAFEIRNRLLTLVDARTHISGLLTFLLGVLYLNYKIREAKAEAGAAVAPELTNAAAA